MSEERVIDYLRRRGRVTPPNDLVAAVMAAVDTSPAASPRSRSYLPAFVVVSAAVVAALVLIIGPGRDVGPAMTPSAPAPATARAVTLDELRAAVTAALEVLRSKPGIEGIGTSHVLDEVASVSWFSWRPNGDQVVVTRTDIDVTETGWWRDPDGGPPNRGANVSTAIQVLVGGSYYFTRGDVDHDDVWISGLRSGSPEVLGVPFPAALDGRMDPWQGVFVLTLEGKASMAHLTDGGETWTLKRPVREGSLIQQFDIGPDGALRSVSHELIGLEPALDERPFTSALVELTVLEDARPIPHPDTESPPDPAALGVPDLPLSPP